MATRSSIENARQTPKDLAKVCEELGYGRTFGQLQFDNGAFASAILDFFEDNPGAIEAVFNFMLDNADALGVTDEEDEEEESEEEQGDEPA